MAITAAVYGNAYKGLGMGRFAFTTTPLYVALFTSAYTPNLTNDETFDDLTGEVTGAGYTSGGQALTGVTWTYTGGTATLTSNTITFAASVTCRRAVVYQHDADPTLAYLLLTMDFGANVGTSGAPFPLAFPHGLFSLSN